jgi:radical SAM protein with 4Fe4S-binding SPASM domain
MKTGGLEGFKYPKWVVLQLLEKCNLRCKMCYEWGQEGSYHEKKDLAQLDLNVVKKVITDCSPGRPYFGLFGGEPLMYPWINEVLGTIRNLGLSVDIPTNGTLIEPLAEMLVETMPRRLWISLDGPPRINDQQRGKGVYEKVSNGIEKLFEVRQRKGRELPKIGVTIIVTPFNYLYIEDLFFKCLDMSKIDHMSIEFQLYATPKQCEEYEAILRREFGVSNAPCAKGIIWDVADFASIDILELMKQILRVKQYCHQNNIYFLTYPKTIQEGNLRSFLTADWQNMLDKRERCSFPWIYTEINAKGDVSPCHTFYDLTHGNVYEQGILDIWNGPQYNKYRSYMRKNLFPICTACSRYYADPAKK